MRFPPIVKAVHTSKNVLVLPASSVSRVAPKDPKVPRGTMQAKLFIHDVNQQVERVLTPIEILENGQPEPFRISQQPKWEMVETDGIEPTT
jgi:hypothetical protein